MIKDIHTQIDQACQFLFGKHKFLNLKDLQYVYSRDKRKSEQQDHLRKIEKDLSIYLAGGALSSVGLNFLLQKSFSQFSKLTPSRLIVDLGLASLCLGFGLYLSLGSIEPHLNEIKKIYLQSNDLGFKQHLKNVNTLYGISLQNQVKTFLNENEYEVFRLSGELQLLSLI